MKRRYAVAVALAYVYIAGLLAPAQAQEPSKSAFRFSTKPSEQARAIAERLKYRIPVGWLQEAEKLTKVLNVFSAKYKVNILVDKAAFGEDVSPYDTLVKLPGDSDTMPMETALRLIIEQLADGKATFWIHTAGYITITRAEQLNVRRSLYEPNIIAVFERTPLQEALNELARRAGVPIYLDAVAGKKSRTSINALFNNDTLEQALVAVTETAHLKYVVLERGILVTTAENAKLVAAEEKERAAAREAFLKASGPGVAAAR